MEHLLQAAGHAGVRHAAGRRAGGGLCEQDRVPEGRLMVARRFNAGYAGTNNFRPVGTAETSHMTLREVGPLAEMNVNSGYPYPDPEQSGKIK